MNMMAKKAVRFGTPQYVVRTVFMPYLFLTGVVAAYFIGSILKEDEIVSTVWLDSLQSFLVLLVFPIVVCIGSTLALLLRFVRYRARFKQLKGRVCFMCNYELGKGIKQCPECGADWSTKHLSDRWRMHIEQNSC